MTKPADDLEAIRLVVQALEPFDSKDRERIIRWAAEKLGMSQTPALGAPAVATTVTPHHKAVEFSPATTTTPKDIKSFVTTKQPKSDNQMAAVVAYYYHFEAPPAERKDSIGKEELIDACRMSDRKRPARPEQVLVNAYHAGLLDKAGSAGQYRLNSVGENLVAMVLPEQNSSSSQMPRKAKGAVRKEAPGKATKRHATTRKAK